MFDYLKIIIRDQPTVDAVEVVRCKDCKYLTVYNSPTLYAYCQKTHLRFEPFKEDTRTHFCSYGEKKANADLEGEIDFDYNAED